MLSRVHSRIKALPRAAFRLVQDTVFVRLVLAAIRLWRDVRFPALLLTGVLVLCLAFAGVSARTVFSALRPATTTAIGPGIAAVFTFLIVLELCAASALTALQGLLRLSYDTGRHRIGALLTMLALIAAGVAALALAAVAAGSASLPGHSALFIATPILGLVALWFDRVYRRPAFPRFRDFHADIVDVRDYLVRASHGR
jgi:hypothetical protein